MKPLRILGAALFATVSLDLAGCVTDDYGSGYGYGISSGYYGGSYAYGSPYYGWYDDFYYPGTGYYVYDRGGRRQAWSDGQRRYWEGRRGNRSVRQDWSGFRRDGSSATSQPRREAWRAQRQQQGAVSGDWQQRREAWRAERQSQPQATTEGRGGNGWRGNSRSWRRGN